MLTRSIYKGDNYDKIADPRLTNQKANKIVSEWIQSETISRNEIVKKLQEKFDYIHYIYSLLFPKINNRINNFGVQNKSKFEFAISLWKLKKQQKNDQTNIKSFF